VRGFFFRFEGLAVGCNGSGERGPTVPTKRAVDGLVASWAPRSPGKRVKRRLNAGSKLKIDFIPLILPGFWDGFMVAGLLNGILPVFESSFLDL